MLGAFVEQLALAVVNRYSEFGRIHIPARTGLRQLQ
jgi:hypothetical protein